MADLTAEEVLEAAGLLGAEIRVAIERALSALRAGLHVIFIGPPGTGKTTIAEAIAKASQGEDGYRTHTATSEWTTFDTIGGYMPAGDDKGLSFTRGLIIDAIESDRWLIIDEINRADIDKAFGELFTLLSTGRVRLAFGERPGSERIELIAGGSDNLLAHQIAVTQNWRMLGTMNNLDKASLHQLS